MIKDEKGFTLLELMIAVSLGSSCLVLVHRPCRACSMRMPLKFESRTLLKYLRFARSQAIDNQQSVTVCLANASDNCVTANPTQFLVFVDGNGNDIFNNGEQILARSPQLSDSLTAANNRTSTTFSPDGTSLGTNATITLCRSGNAQINLVISPSGRTTQSTQANICL